MLDEAAAAADKALPAASFNGKYQRIVMHVTPVGLYPHPADPEQQNGHRPPNISPTSNPLHSLHAMTLLVLNLSIFLSILAIVQFMNIKNIERKKSRFFYRESDFEG